MAKRTMTEAEFGAWLQKQMEVLAEEVSIGLLMLQFDAPAATPSKAKRNG